MEPDNHTIDGFIVCKLTGAAGYDTFLDSVKAVDGIYVTEPYYRNEFDSAFLVGSRFCVAFSKGMTLSQIDSIGAVFKAVRGYGIDGLQNTYILYNTDSSGRRTLDLANAYYELPETEYAHPIFGVRAVPFGYKLYDYYNGYQSHIKKVIGNFNTATVWDFGGLLTDSVVVADIDDGVESHEDLPASRILPGYDFSTGDDDPTPGTEFAHGMAIAGIIAASHCADSVSGQSSTTGVAGLNPACKILPVKTSYDNGNGVSYDSVAKAIGWAWEHGADVINISWGYPWSCPGGWDILNSAIDSAAVYGRGYPRGCPVICASGNDSGSVKYPACRPKVLAVGALKLNDTAWAYSSHGAGLALMAPVGDRVEDGIFYGDMWTLDQMGQQGYNIYQFNGGCPPGNNDWDYDCRFGGTSAAAPVVAGVASLILAYDSTLIRDSVYSILKHSAVTLPAGSTPPNNQYGYGRVDAFRAILSIARGNIDNDPGKNIDISDFSRLIDFLYISFEPPFPSIWLADVDCDGYIDVSDVSRLYDFLFGSMTPLPLPCFEYGD